MPITHYIVATAGHVDHGKSSLVKALTGIDPDRLPEEKARGITIDLGFAHLEIPAPLAPSTAPFLNQASEAAAFSLGIIDVPGHEDFVKNMVAGVGSIDLALFVIAVDDGWMPQTEEHLQILTYLGVRHAVIALTKIDLASDNELVAIERIREQLRDSPFAGSSIVPTSIVTGRGLDELKSALSAALAHVAAPRDLGKPRLPIDRVFTLHGIGTVVTGTLSGGVLRRNQTVTLQPTGRTTRIRTIQTHSRQVEQTGPGMRTALNLPDVPVASTKGEGVVRGEVVTLAELGAATTTVDVLIEKSARLREQQLRAARPLKDGTLVRVHHGSANVPARIRLRDGDPLSPGQRTLARLRFEEPLFLIDGDRFIVRDWPEQLTLAGGVILDCDASRQQFASEEQQQFLQRRAEALDDAAVWILTLLKRDHAVPRASVLLRSRFSADETSVRITELVSNASIHLVGDWVADTSWWKALLSNAADQVQHVHRAQPDRVGVGVSDLRRAMEKDLPAGELFDVLLVEMCRGDFAQTGNAIRHRSHRPSLPPHLQATGAKLRAALAGRPFEPPPRKELAADSVSQQALRFLIETGEAVEIGQELVMSNEALPQARETIRRFLIEHGQATASDLRQLLNTSRRVIIPLLEKLDKDGITQRQGDVRVLRAK
jgi:selenocysteine-specific elongation factor